MNTKTRMVGVLSTLTLAAASMVAVAGPAAAALPEPPDNLVVFPDRDFLTVEGYEQRVGEPATVRVWRGATQVGHASSSIDAGGVAFEVNHPGGVCWGTGAPNAGLNVTPDLQGGDRVEVEFADGRKDDITIQPVKVLQESVAGATVTVVSEVPASLPLDRLEGRIIQPELRTTAVARRDVRAVDGSTGDTGYSSSLTRGLGDTVVAKYSFADAATAQTALAGTSRIMAWQQTVGGERVGITIAEHEELGGPGMGGCPAGPAESGQPAPGGASYTRSADGTAMVVNWTAAAPIAGGGTVSAYQVTLTDASGVITGRKMAASATRATVNGLTAATSYTIEVRAAVGARLSEPFTVEAGGQPPAPADPTLPPQDLPTLTATQRADGSVTVQTNGDSVYYTFGDTLAISAGLPTDEAVLYTTPIPVTTADTKINFVAFNPAGNYTTLPAIYSPAVAPPVPAALVAPTLNSAVGGPGTVTLVWTQVPDAVDYKVMVTAPNVATTLTTTARSHRVDNLTAGVAYSFRVVAQAGDRVSPASNVLTAMPSMVVSKPVISRALWKAGDLRIEGTSDKVAGTTSIYRYTPVSGSRGALIGTTQLTAAVPPGVGGTYVLRLRGAAAGTANPGWLVAVADDGAQSPPFLTTTR